MIRVICLDLSGGEEFLGSLWEAASEERRERAEKMRRQEDRLRCLAAEALVRFALGGETQTLEKGPGGKPYVKDLPGVHFNLSHSGRYVAVAVGDSEVGLDVERLREDRDLFALAKRFFTGEEGRHLAAASDPGRCFFELWTAKESYLKYLGTGLRKKPDSFSVLSPEPGIRFFHRWLEGDYCLCLCCEEIEFLTETVDLEQLLRERKSG